MNSGRPTLPIAFALDLMASYLKKAAWAEPSDDLVDDTTRASYLVTVFAVEEVIERKERVIRAR